jgi:hypothetical protein
MTIHIVLNVVKLLNFFPTKGGVSDTLSPKTIMSGETLYYKNHLSLHIGQYCQVHEEYNPHNSHITRTKGAISLGPSGNLQGGFNFMALNTGNKIIRRSWDVIPMPNLVIARVDALGSDHPQQITFIDIHGRLIGDIKILGVDADEDDDDNDPLPGVVPGLDVEVPEAQDEVPAPQVEIDDLYIPHDDPAPIEVSSTQAAQTPETPAPVAPPAQAPGLRRSTRVRSHANQGYTPIMAG